MSEAQDSEDEACTGESEQRDPLDLTLREVASLCGDSSFDRVDADELPGEMPPHEVVPAAFSEIHPAAAGRILRRMAEGLDDGYTGHGPEHPDFQHVLQSLQTEGDTA